MPVFKSESVLHLARSLRAFLKLEVGLTRAVKRKGSKRAGKPLRSKVEGEQEERLIKPENLIWIFGYGRGRCGTTWLSQMLRDYGTTNVWVGPMIGLVLGHVYYSKVVEGREIAWERERPDFILGSNKETRSGPLRSLILEAATARFPHLAEIPEQGRLVVHEVHGSLGAPLIMEALPESPMILMVRDPRDAVASQLAAEKTGSWLYEEVRKPHGANGVAADEEDFFVRECVEHNRKSFDKAREAFEAHPGPKVMLRYEDLRAEPLGEMRRLLLALKQPLDEAELNRVVEKHLWENVPAEEKGEGKFHRRGSPGSYGEDLSAEQIQTVERAFAPIMERFGYEPSDTSV